SCDCAVLASGEAFPDALVASSVAGYHDCPVILTKGSSLSAQAKAELERLGVSTVYIMGGTVSISSSTESQVKALNGGVTTVRIAGADRKETSLKAMQHLSGYDTVVIASGEGFADGLSIGPFSYWSDSPILLGTKGSLSSDQMSALGTCGASRIVIIGGTAVVSESTESTLKGMFGDGNVVRLAGDTRYETSAKVAWFSIEEGMGARNMAVANGENFPDALAGAALCGHNASVLTLVKPSNIFAVDTVLLGDDDHSGYAGDVRRGFVLGGTTAVPESIKEHLEELTD
ncbi:MAG: cell wall-binding repeat-containing protein, partial [bacterium]|nr:cell wall-binding repeat-containing protein [bacterium]